MAMTVMTTVMTLMSITALTMSGGEYDKYTSVDIRDDDSVMTMMKGMTTERDDTMMMLKDFF